MQPASCRDFSHIAFSCDAQRIDLQQVRDLLQIGAFWAQNRTLEDLAVALANSEPVVTAWDGHRLMGFARVTSDGVYRATLWDVVIHPDYRGGGLGRKLVQTALAHPKVARVERVYLMTSSQQRFYERIGFEENLTTTLVLHNRRPAVVLPDLSLTAQPVEG